MKSCFPFCLKKRSHFSYGLFNIERERRIFFQVQVQNLVLKKQTKNVKVIKLIFLTFPWRNLCWNKKSRNPVGNITFIFLSSLDRLFFQRNGLSSRPTMLISFATPSGRRVDRGKRTMVYSPHVQACVVNLHFRIPRTRHCDTNLKMGKNLKNAIIQAHNCGKSWIESTNSLKKLSCINCMTVYTIGENFFRVGYKPWELLRLGLGV